MFDQHLMLEFQIQVLHVAGGYMYQLNGLPPEQFCTESTNSLTDQLFDHNIL